MENVDEVFDDMLKEFKTERVWDTNTRQQMQTLLYHIDKIQKGLSLRFELEGITLEKEMIIALCKKNGIPYKICKATGDVKYIGRF